MGRVRLLKTFQSPLSAKSNGNMISSSLELLQYLVSLFFGIYITQDVYTTEHQPCAKHYSGGFHI